MTSITFVNLCKRCSHSHTGLIKELKSFHLKRETLQAIEKETLTKHKCNIANTNFNMWPV
jgi:hypothetical protein